MSITEIPNELQRAFSLSKESIYFWVNDLEKANLMDILLSDIRLLENFINSAGIVSDIKARAEVCYQAVSKSTLPKGSAQRSAARSVAHCLFAVWLWQGVNYDKASKAIRDSRYNAKEALGMHS
jgi:hypothetical protein